MHCSLDRLGRRDRLDGFLLIHASSESSTVDLAVLGILEPGLYRVGAGVTCLRHLSRRVSLDHFDCHQLPSSLHNVAEQSVRTGSISTVPRHQWRATAAAADGLPAAATAAVRLWAAAATGWLSSSSIASRLRQPSGAAAADVCSANRLWKHPEHGIPAVVPVRAVSEGPGDRPQLRGTGVGCVIRFAARCIRVPGSLASAADSASAAVVPRRRCCRSGSILSPAQTDAATTDSRELTSAAVSDNATATGDQAAGAVWRAPPVVHEEQQAIARVVEYGCLGSSESVTEPARKSLGRSEEDGHGVADMGFGHGRQRYMRQVAKGSRREH